MVLTTIQKKGIYLAQNGHVNEEVVRIGLAELWVVYTALSTQRCLVIS